MLTRRGFAGFASCAICGITEFIATEASAQGTPPPATAGVTRKILSQTDGPTPGLCDATRGSDHRAGRARRTTHASGGRIRLCAGRRLRASHPRSSDSHDQKRRRFPNPARNPACGWEAWRRQERHSHHLCRGEGKAPRLSGLSAEPALVCLPRGARGSSVARPRRSPVSNGGARAVGSYLADQGRRLRAWWRAFLYGTRPHRPPPARKPQHPCLSGLLQYFLLLALANTGHQEPSGSFLGAS